MTAIGPGDFVECVHDSGSTPGRLTVGALYVVRAIHSGPFDPPYDGVGFEIEGVPSRSVSGWADKLFRPIYRPRADLIERLLQPIDETTPEQVPA